MIQIVRKDSKEAYDLLRKINVLSRSNDYVVAMKLCDDALEGLINDTILVLTHKSLVLNRLKRNDEASACMEKILNCLDSLPDKSDFYYFTHKASTLKTLGRFDEAIKCYDEALNHEAFKDLPGAQVKLFQYKIQVLNRLQRYDDAIEVCDSAMQSTHNNYFLREKEEAIKARDKEKSKYK
jgi:tetratricopeptide (TPR) repeat protein